MPDGTVDRPPDQPSLEAEKIRGDLRIREAELDIRRAELEIKRLEQQRAAWRHPITVVVVAALIGFVSNACQQSWRHRDDLELERERLKTSLTLEREKLQVSTLLQRSQMNSSLVIEAVKTGNVDEAKTNLGFLVEVGFVDDPKGRIRASLESRRKVPVLPPSSSPPTPMTFSPLKNLYLQGSVAPRVFEYELLRQEIETPKGEVVHEVSSEIRRGLGAEPMEAFIRGRI
jgi:hypothetical protein